MEKGVPCRAGGRYQSSPSPRGSCLQTLLQGLPNLITSVVKDSPSPLKGRGALVGTVLRQENTFSEEHCRQWPGARANPASQGGSALRLCPPTGQASQTATIFYASWHLAPGAAPLTPEGHTAATSPSVTISPWSFPLACLSHYEPPVGLFLHLQ